MVQGRRTELQSFLEELLGSSNVYFQPPDTTRMNYPCLVYSRDNNYKISANNKGYRTVQRYQVTAISRNPDNPIIDDLLKLPRCSYSRGFVADGLTHDAFELYF